MGRQDNVLYPSGYSEPVEASANTAGRDFVEARRLIESAVIMSSPPLTIAQFAPIVIGRSSEQGEAMLEVGVSPIADIRVALLSGVGGIIADTRTSSIKRSEIDIIFAEIVAEREDSWTFQIQEDVGL